MTIICAISDGKETWVGADSMAVGNGAMINSIEKWSFAHGWAAGAAGNLKTINLLHENADKLFDRLSGPGEFVARLATMFEGYNTDSEQGPKSFGQDIILASQNGVWSICETLSYVHIPRNHLWADGYGGHFGLGAGNLKGDSRTNEERVRAAVYGAISNTNRCGGEIMVRELQ